MVYASLDIEKSLWCKGLKLICGVDEVGRGCFAGPVVVGAVIFSPDSEIPEGIADSKLLKPKDREKLDPLIKQNCLGWSIAEISVEIINKVGIGRATQQAFLESVKSLKVPPEFVLIDAFLINDFDPAKQQAVQNGDKISVSIAAASIIAKVYRDKLMSDLHQQYPEYNFAKHKGYGTKEHQQAIKIHGLSNLHRTSFDLSKFL